MSKSFSIFALDSDAPISVIAAGELKHLDVELDGKCGLRVKWTGPHECTIEMTDENGKWVKVPGMQKLVIHMDAADPFPRVDMHYLVYREDEIEKKEV